MNSPKVAIYCRYSSGQQREASIEDQLRACRELCQRHGFEDPAVYKDAAMSGQRMDRPEYSALLEAAQNKQFQVLVMWELKRLSRAEDIPQVVACLQFWGVRIITCDGLDTSQEGSDLRAWIDGMMGNRYNKELARNTHRGLTGQALGGYSAGGLPYGYRSVHDGNGFKRVIDETQTGWVRYIFEQFAAGVSPRAIATDLNSKAVKPPRGALWSQTAIYGDLKRGTGILCNGLYIGQQVWNRSKWIKDPRTGLRKRVERPETDWIITEDEALRIIPQDLWNAVRRRQIAIRSTTAKLQARAGKMARPGRGPGYLFSGLLKCGLCDGNYVLVNKYQYGCTNYKNHGRCENRMKVSRAVVEGVLLTGIRDELLSDAHFKLFESETRRLLKAARPDPKAARNEITKAQQEIDNLVNALRQGITSTAVKLALNDAEARLKQAKAQLADIEAFEPTQILPRVRQVHRRMVEELSQINNVPRAREQLKSLLGDAIKLVPERGVLIAEVKGSMAALSKINVVAGAGFETYLTLRLPLKAAPL